MTKLKADWEKEAQDDWGIDTEGMTVPEIEAAIQEKREKRAANENKKEATDAPAETSGGAPQGEGSETPAPPEANNGPGPADQPPADNPEAVKNPNTGPAPEKVRVKFRLGNIIGLPSGTKQYEFFASQNCEENKSFAEYAPQGTFALTVSDGTEAHKMFELGKEYFLDFSAAE